MMEFMTFFWISFIALAVLIYVILDGFDLGIGMMSVFFKSEADRDLMVGAILPFWDGNETWLVFGVAAMYGAFPKAFGTIMPALYVPMLVMVMSLLFRGVSFEFRLKAEKSKRLWDYAFFGGSLVATLMQGVILGTFVQGFHMDHLGDHLAWYQWLNPFGLFCGMALVCGYVQLGANFLMAKTTGSVQAASFRCARWTQYLIILAAIAVSVWSPFLHPDIMRRWFDIELMHYWALLPIIGLLFWLLHYQGLQQRQEYSPFWMTVGVFFSCYLGFIVSCYPYIVPRLLRFQDAVASRSALAFMTVGGIIMLPILLFYTVYAYRVFRGKVTEHIHY